jgi:hypothetical protein
MHHDGYQSRHKRRNADEATKSRERERERSICLFAQSLGSATLARSPQCRKSLAFTAAAAAAAAAAALVINTRVENPATFHAIAPAERFFIRITF